MDSRVSPYCGIQDAGTCLLKRLDKCDPACLYSDGTKEQAGESALLERSSDNLLVAKARDRRIPLKPR
jgi:hypothetical protein